MRLAIRGLFIFLLFAIHGKADDIDLEVRNGYMLKMLRDMTNKTNASESLNLPANATSIRENITDTFSCENRTYGYYADVDNDCQIFHVCLPSQTPSGRNVTYRWSFICPNETIFNQEVLVCTRPSDSIPCEDSPNYYDLNMEIGKTPKNDSKNKENEKTKYERDNNKTYNNERDRYISNNDRNSNRHESQKRRTDNRKQNIVVDKLFQDIVDEEMREKLQAIDLGDNVEEIFPDLIAEEVPEENVFEYSGNKEEIAMADDIQGRLALERRMGDYPSLRAFRFKADV